MLSWSSETAPAACGCGAGLTNYEAGLPKQAADEPRPFGAFVCKRPLLVAAVAVVLVMQRKIFSPAWRFVWSSARDWSRFFLSWHEWKNGWEPEIKTTS